MKAYWESGGIAPRILDLGSRWRWVVSFTARPLYFQAKSPWYALDRRLDGPESRSGRGGEGKKSQPLPGFEPPIIQPIAQRYTTEVFRNWLGNKISAFKEPKYLSPESHLTQIPVHGPGFT
jgi:hypothetical protein